MISRFFNHRVKQWERNVWLGTAAATRGRKRCVTTPVAAARETRVYTDWCIKLKLADFVLFTDGTTKTLSSSNFTNKTDAGTTRTNNWYKLWRFIAKILFTLTYIGTSCVV